MGWNYSEKTKQIFMDAVQGKPGTHLGEIEDADGFGEHGSIACGDALRFTFRCEKHPSDPLKDVIVECRYLTFGCTSAIAASEALCALIEEGGYTPVSALQISNKDIVRYLDGLPEQKIHWERFTVDHKLEECEDCHEVHIVCRRDPESG